MRGEGVVAGEGSAARAETAADGAAGTAGWAAAGACRAGSAPNARKPSLGGPCWRAWLTALPLGCAPPRPPPRPPRGAPRDTARCPWSPPPPACPCGPPPLPLPLPPPPAPRCLGGIWSVQRTMYPVTEQKNQDEQSRTKQKAKKGKNPSIGEDDKKKNCQKEERKIRRWPLVALRRAYARHNLRSSLS